MDFDMIVPVKNITSNFGLFIQQSFLHIKPRKIIFITKHENFAKMGGVQCDFALPSQSAQDSQNRLSQIPQKIEFLDEDEVFPSLNFRAVCAYINSDFNHYRGHREGWYFQQFLKMAFALRDEFGIHESSADSKIRESSGATAAQKYYLIWDFDTFALQDFCFFRDNKVIFELRDEYHMPYFDTLARLKIHCAGMHLYKNVKKSFIAEHMMVDALKMRELIALIEARHKKVFWQAILDSIAPQNLAHSGFSEFETYGNFVALEYPNEVEFIIRKRDRFAKKILGAHPSAAQLEWYKCEFEAISLESWDSDLGMRTNYAIMRLLPPKFFRAWRMMHNKIDAQIRKTKDAIKATRAGPFIKKIYKKFRAD